MIATAPAADGTRRLIQVLAAAGFASAFSSRALEPLIGVIARDLDSTPQTIALLSAAFALPYAFIQPILGPFGDAVGKERIMKICLAVLTAALAGTVVAPDTGTLFALRIVAGMAAGGAVPLALALIGDRVEVGRRQVALSRYLAAVIVGQLAGSTLAGLLESSLGWRGVFALSTALMLLGWLATVVGFRGGAPAGRFSLGLALERYGIILRTRRAVTLFALVFFEAIAVFGVFPYLAPLLESRGGGPAEAGLAIAGFAVGGLAYAGLVGWLLRRHGLGRMMVAGGVFAASGLVTIGLAGHWSIDAGAMLALGFGFYMLHNSFQTQVSEAVPQARASTISLHAFSYFCGQAIGVVLMGAGLAAIGQFPAFAIAALQILVVGLLAAHLIAGRDPAYRAR